MRKKIGIGIVVTILSLMFFAEIYTDAQRVGWATAITAFFAAIGVIGLLLLGVYLIIFEK